MSLKACGRASYNITVQATLVSLVFVSLLLQTSIPSLLPCRTIAQQTRADRHTLMFSATWPSSIQKLAAEFLCNPVKVTIGSQDLSASHSVTQVCCPALPCPALPCPALPRRAPPCPALPRPAACPCAPSVTMWHLLPSVLSLCFICIISYRRICMCLYVSFCMKQHHGNYPRRDISC